MKIILNLFLVLALLAGSCTKQELNVIDEAIELDENSPEFQAYMVERAKNFIKMYRFEKLDGILDRITDPAMRTEILQLYREYKTQAENEGLFIITESKDSLFFIPPINPTVQGTALGTNFMIDNPRHVNAKGTIHGFQNFPTINVLHFHGHRATGLEGLEYLPNMKRLYWKLVPFDMMEKFPDEPFEYEALRADLSHNAQLEEIEISGIALGNMIFPDHELKFLKARDVKIPSGGLDGLWAKEIEFLGEADPDFKMKNVKTDSLLFGALVQTFDIRETEIKGVNIERSVEKLLLNDNLKRLWLNGDKLLSKPEFPQSLEELSLGSYGLSNKDFSSLTNLKKINLGSKGYEGVTLPTNIEELTFSVPSPYAQNSVGISRDYSHLSRLKKVRIEGGDIDQSGLVFPSSLEHLSFFEWSMINVRGQGDYSNLVNLKTFEVNQTSFEYMPVLPTSLSRLDIKNARFSAGSTVDLSLLNSLNFLRVYAYNSDPITLILPDNLTEDAVAAGMGRVNSRSGSILLPTGSTIVNAPAWLSQYVYIGAL